MAIFRLLVVLAGLAQAKEWRDESVTCNTSKVEYGISVYGNNSAKYRFVMLHGFPDFGESWMWYLMPEMKTAFGEDFQMIAPDLRGVGRTQSPGRVMEKQKEFYDHNNMIADLVEIWDHYGFDQNKKPWVIAHDWGAFLGWNFYFRNPKMFAGYVAMSAPPMYINQLKIVDPQLQAIGTYNDSFALNQPFWGNAITTSLFGKPATGPAAFSSWFPGHAENATQRMSSPHPESLASHLMWYQYHFDQHSSDDGSEPRTQCDDLDKENGTCKPFNEMDWPVVGYIAGADDFWLSPKRMACCATRKMPNLHFELISEQGHFIPHEQPKAVTDFIKKMVTDPNATQSLGSFCDAKMAEYWSAETQSFCPEAGGKVEPQKNMLELCKMECPSAMNSLEMCITSRATDTASMNGQCVASYCENMAAYEDCLRSQPSCKAMTDLSAPYGIVLTSNVFLNMTICSQFAPSMIRKLDSKGLPSAEEHTITSSSTGQHFITSGLVSAVLAVASQIL